MAGLNIAIAQINCHVGDIDANVDRICAAAHEALALGADVLLTPELALVGYPPEDLLLRRDFHHAAAAGLARLAAQTPLPIIVGHPLLEGDICSNAASLVADGGVTTIYRKQRLANYEVFDESRYFTAGDEAGVVEICGVRCGVIICADAWVAAPASQALAAGAELLLVLNASPFYVHKQPVRHDLLRQRCAETGLAVIYCNMVGGQDELVFDGASCAFASDGQLRLQAPTFVEHVALARFVNGALAAGATAASSSLEAQVYAALRLGVSDYVGKNGFPGVIIGLSGGVDSALTLALAVDALGAEKVRAVMMPSPHTAQMSLDDAREMARRLGVEYDEIPIDAAMQCFETLLAPVFNRCGALGEHDVSAENIQARCRGLILMALSNRSGRMVLTTGNKSEMAVGYATLYGDMAGGYAVLKDVYKTLVWSLARWRNEMSPVIPQNIIDRPPSAELRPGQTDQDSLPPYEMLDAVIEAYMEQEQSPAQIVARGWPQQEVQRVVRLLRRNEYKRRQAPPGVRISRRAFGRDWRYPITSRLPEEWS